MPHNATTLFSLMGIFHYTACFGAPPFALPATILSALLLFAAGPPAMAMDLDVRSAPSNVLDFSLLIEHSVTELERDSNKVDANVERIGILTIDVPRDGPRFGLALGYAFSDFDNNDLYLPISMDGYYLGVSVQGLIVETSTWSVTARAEYIFQDVDGSDMDNNTASLSWHEYSVGVSLRFALSSALRIVVEPVYTDINGTYRERGVSSQTVKLDSSKGSGLHAELQYWLNDRESISVQYRNAALQGFALRFRRFF
ncbi:MAG: hypothetical protein PVH04_09540 [Gammaproteobacteria bacterium]